MADWYQDAFDNLKSDLIDEGLNRLDGSKFVRDYAIRNDLFSELDDDAREEAIIEHIETFEIWLKENFSDILYFGKNYFWSIKTTDNRRLNQRENHVSKQSNVEKEYKYLDEETAALDEAKAKALYKAALTLAKEERFQEGLVFAKSYYDYLKYNNAPETKQLEALNAILRVCYIEIDKPRADKYEYHIKKSEIYVRSYEHSLAADEYKLALQHLINEVPAENDKKGHQHARIQHIDDIIKLLYKKCRIQYENTGMTKEASDMFVEENKFIQSKLRRGFKRAGMFSFWVLARYGESPGLVAFWAVFVIILWSLFYMATGINSPGGPENYQCLPSYTMIICEQIEDISIQTPPYWSHLYYSVVTFTTLGYGDFSPIEGFSRFFSAVQALLGLLLTSLFLATFIKKYSR